MCSFYRSRFHNSPKQMCALLRPHEPHSATAPTTTRSLVFSDKKNMQLRSHIYNASVIHNGCPSAGMNLYLLHVAIFFGLNGSCALLCLYHRCFFFPSIFFFFFFFPPLLKSKQTHSLIVDAKMPRSLALCTFMRLSSSVRHDSFPFFLFFFLSSLTHVLDFLLLLRRSTKGAMKSGCLPN